METPRPLPDLSAGTFEKAKTMALWGVAGTLGVVAAVTSPVLFAAAFGVSYARGEALRKKHVEQVKSKGTRVPTDSPLHQDFVKLCQKAGLRHTPDLYFAKTDSIAAATMLRGQHIVLLNPDHFNAENAPSSDGMRFHGHREKQAILAHEIAHIRQRHLQKTGIFLDVALSTATCFLASAGGAFTIETLSSALVSGGAILATAVGSLVATNLMVNTYSRMTERQADRIGGRIVGNHIALRNVFRPSLLELIFKSPEETSFFSSHPTDRERFAYLEQEAARERVRKEAGLASFLNYAENPPPTAAPKARDQAQEVMAFLCGDRAPKGRRTYTRRPDQEAFVAVADVKKDTAHWHRRPTHVVAYRRPQV